MSIEARNRPLPDWFTRIRTHQTVLLVFNASKRGGIRASFNCSTRSCRTCQSVQSWFWRLETRSLLCREPSKAPRNR